MDIYLSLIITLVLCVQNGLAQVYDRSNQGYTSVPSIPTDASEINLNNNKLSSLGANTFSAHTSLAKLFLEDNEITTIDATAFSSTVIYLLKLARNKLIEFPDLTAISGTLTALYISANDFTTMPSDRCNLPKVETFTMKNMELTEWPAFDLIGASPTSSIMTLSLSWYPKDYNITNVCHFTAFEISEHVNPAGVRSAPRIVCPPGSKLNTLNLGENNLDIDFEDLSYVGDLLNLYIHANNLTEFPNLPTSLRSTVLLLLLYNNPIESIDPAYLEGYDNLNAVYLDGTSLTSVPAALFSIAPTVSLSGVKLQMSELMWNEILCDAETTTSLKLAGSFDSLAQFPPLKGALCQRSTSLALDLTKISVPCDCSILWMSKTMSECPGTVSFNLDQLPCGAADWTDVPATIAVNHDCRADDWALLYLDFDTDPKMVTAFKASLGGQPEDNAVSYIIIRGSLMWHVYDSPSWELSQSHWVLGPGSHSGGTDFDDNAVSSIRQISDTYELKGVDDPTTDDQCTGTLDYPSNKLIDGDKESCVTINNQIVTVSKNITADTTAYVTVDTRDMPCSHRFHVAVYALCPDQCPYIVRCPLSEHSEDSETGDSRCQYECNCSNGQEDWEVSVRVIHVFEGHLCGVVIDWGH